MFQLPSDSLDLMEHSAYEAKFIAWHPAFKSFTCLPDYILIIPVQNEEERIVRCLQSCKNSMEHCSAYGRILLLINNSTDKTIEKAIAFSKDYQIALDSLMIEFPSEKASAGLARALACDIAASMLGPKGVILSTDADSVLDENFIREHLAITNKGAALVCGHVKLCEEEKKALPKSYLAQIALEENYAQLSLKLKTLLDPDPFNPKPQHEHQSGANFALTLHSYSHIGGLPKLKFGEDRALVQRVFAHDLPIIYSHKACVKTSARLDGRAQHGMSQTIKRRLQEEDFYCDGSLEEAEMTFKRAQLKAILRETWHTENNLSSFFKDIGLNPCQQKKASNFYNFGATWSYIEQTSPYLKKMPLKLSQIKKEISLIKTFLEPYGKSSNLSPEQKFNRCQKNKISPFIQPQFS